MINTEKIRRKTRGKQISYNESDEEQISDPSKLMKVQLEEGNALDIESSMKIKTEVIENDDFEIKAPPHLLDNSESSEEDLIAKVWKNLPKIDTPKRTNSIELTKNPRQMNSNKSRKTKNEREQCPQCGILVCNVRTHFRNVHIRPKVYFCDLCGFAHHAKNRIEKHIYKHLSKETKIELNGISCELCGLKLLGSDSLKMHMLNVHTERPANFVCFCGEAYMLERALKQHQKRKHTERVRNLECKVCGKKFFRKIKFYPPFKYKYSYLSI